MSRRARQGIAVFAVVAAFTVVVLLRPGRTPNGDATARADSPATSVEQSPFVISPYLQYPTQTSITIMWETAVAGTSVVEYGPTPAALKTAEGEKNATIHEVKIDGLDPET